MIRGIFLSLTILLLFLASLSPVSAGQDTAYTQPEITPVGVTAPAASQHTSRLTEMESADLVEKLDVAADTIWSLGKDSGFAGQVVYEPEGRIEVYWKGPVPKAVKEYIASLSDLGIRVEVASTARYTRAEAQEAAQRITASALSGRLGMVSASVRPDGSGITVQTAGAAPQAADAARVADTADLSAADIRFEPNAENVVQLDSRDHDQSPWKGGAHIIFGSNGGCSTGFAVLSGAHGRLLSAAHCGGNVAVWGLIPIGGVEVGV